MRGSYSLKRVLPAMVPEFVGAYDALDVSEGGAASAGYLGLIERSEEQRYVWVVVCDDAA